MSSVPANPTFGSILWPDAEATGDTGDDTRVPACFHDLNLDQIVDAVTAAWPDEDLAPFFHVPSPNTATIAYRQAVFDDLEAAPLRQAIERFVQHFRQMHAGLTGTEKIRPPYRKAHAFLHTAEDYGLAVQGLTDDLERLQPASTGLRALHAHLTAYTTSAVFVKLFSDTRELRSALATLRYGLVIRNGSVTVCACENEADASVEVENTFAKFRRDTGPDHRDDKDDPVITGGFNHVDGQILDRIALLNPQTFAALDTFRAEHEAFVDTTIDRFAREVCFYLAWTQYVEPLRRAGLPLCYPDVDAESKAIACEDSFDVALATRLVKKQQAVVCNGLALRGRERIVVVSGPNHGGKTTFARMLGQLHWLAALGCPVPGTRARLFLFDRLLTHFEREESIETLRGKLKDDLVRMHHVLAQATPRSLIILNEIFASTTLDDAVRLGRRIVAQISNLDALSVCVTFLTELADCDAKTISAVAGIDPQDPAIRTFKIERRPADGLAYAMAIARKYDVTRAALLQRIAP